MYVVDNSHWMHLNAGLLLQCQDSIVDESKGSEAKSQHREFQWLGLPYGPKTDR